MTCQKWIGNELTSSAREAARVSGDFDQEGLRGVEGDGAVLEEAESGVDHVQLVIEVGREVEEQVEPLWPHGGVGVARNVTRREERLRGTSLWDKESLGGRSEWAQRAKEVFHINMYYAKRFPQSGDR